MTGPERIDYLIRELCGDNARAFSEKIGVGTATTSRLRRGTYHNISKYADKICAAFPEINRSWLLHGVGDSGIVQKKSAADYEAEISRLKRIIDTLTKDIRQKQAIIDKLLP